MVCNAERLSEHVEKNHYDMVYSFGVIHHSPNQRAIVEEIRKVIRHDGEFRCMLYAKNSWKDIMIEAGFDQPEAQRGCPYATTYTPEMVRDLYEGLFEVTSARANAHFPVCRREVRQLRIRAAAMVQGDAAGNVRGARATARLAHADRRLARSSLPIQALSS